MRVPAVDEGPKICAPRDPCNPPKSITPGFRQVSAALVFDRSKVALVLPVLLLPPPLLNRNEAWLGVSRTIVPINPFRFPLTVYGLNVLLIKRTPPPVQ